MKSRILCTFLLLAGTAWSQPYPYQSPDGLLTVTFPGPIQQTIAGVVQTMQMDGGVSYQLVTSSASVDDAAQLAAIRETEERKPGALVSQIRVGQIQGLESIAPRASGGFSLQRFFVVNKIVYNLEAASVSRQPTPEARAFMDSFRFSDRVAALPKVPVSGPGKADPKSFVAFVYMCVSDMKNIGLGAEMYARDHQGKYPSSLEEMLAGRYLQSMPVCRSGGSYNYRSEGRHYQIFCQGHHHKEASLPPDYPRLDENYKVLVGPDQILTTP